MNIRDRQICEKLLSEMSILKEMMDGVSRDSFLADERTSRAVCMTLINIGELVKNLTDETRLAYPHIPWKAIAGFRDIAAHKYQTLRMGDVYETVVTDFPALKEQIERIL